MGIANVLTAAVASMWGLILLAGWAMYRSVVGQHAPGYPNSGQFNYYIVTLAFVLGLLLISAIVANRFRRGVVLLALIAILTGLYVLPHMFFFTRGV